MISTWNRVRVGSRLYNLEIENGCFSAITPYHHEQASAGSSRGNTHDAEGLLYIPAMKDMHCHLDKHFLNEPKWYSRQTIDTLPNQLRREKELLGQLTQSVEERARVMLDTMLQLGTTQIRTHVDVDHEVGLKSLEAVLKVREEYEGTIDIEIVAFPQQGLIRSHALPLMREAMQMGADLVGAVDPGGLDEAIDPCLEEVFGLAVDYQAGVDIHLHDPGHLGVYTIERMTEFTAQAGLKDRVAVSHAWGLGHISDVELSRLADKLREQGVAIISSVPIDRPMPNLPLLRSLGVATMIGTDNVLDAWSPYGNGDMLQRTSRLAERYHWVEDEQLLGAFNYTAVGAIEPKLGERADFMLVNDAINAEHALCKVPEREWVVSHGKIAGGIRAGTRQKRALSR
ncbi:amidohydrolase [Paenibacillus sp. FSL H7-0326]|uniref:amidohydrolase family protein n=1 Tax=Paenibacillus sp. FSL H7-0326 TaxID=1921144 RepID=UPI00096FF726|nr:amidohydrolase family protein [Paenibacillus sp. FSL H7-0326]OMC67375.1 amidohydrolase [Paenibacillus sp. FSL H7-0326]